MQQPCRCDSLTACRPKWRRVCLAVTSVGPTSGVAAGAARTLSQSHTRNLDRREVTWTMRPSRIRNAGRRSTVGATPRCSSGRSALQGEGHALAVAEHVENAVGGLGLHTAHTLQGTAGWEERAQAAEHHSKGQGPKSCLTQVCGFACTAMPLARLQSMDAAQAQANAADAAIPAQESAC